MLTPPQGDPLSELQLDLDGIQDVHGLYEAAVERYGEREARRRLRAILDDVGCVAKGHVSAQLLARGVDLGEP